MGAELTRRTDVPTSVADQMHLAEVLAKSPLLPAHLAGKPANLLAIMYAAQAVDVPLWQAVQSMHVINGKVGMSADLMRAMVQRAGHHFRVIESTGTAATVEVERADDRGHPQRFTFSQKDAETAGLWGKGTWKAYPAALLLARATTAACRVAAADALYGISYTPEEMGAEVDADGNPVAAGASPPAVEPAHDGAATPGGAPAGGGDLAALKKAVVAAGKAIGLRSVTALAEDYTRRNGGQVLVEADEDALRGYLADLDAEAEMQALSEHADEENRAEARSDA